MSRFLDVRCQMKLPSLDCKAVLQIIFERTEQISMRTSENEQLDAHVCSDKAEAAVTRLAVACVYGA